MKPKNEKKGILFKITISLVILLGVTLEMSACKKAVVEETAQAAEQYATAVDQASLQESLAYIKYIYDAELRYFLTTEKYTNNFDDLDISFKGAKDNTLEVGNYVITLDAPNLQLTQKGSSEKGFAFNMETREESCEASFCQQ